MVREPTGQASASLADAAIQSLPRADKSSFSEEAFDAVRGWIVRGRLSADSIISERSIALELNLSRTPVREALGRLIGEGLLRREGRSVVVNAVRVEDVLEILSIRRLLEGEAILLATPVMPDAQIEWLREAEQALLSQDVVTSAMHWDVDNQFHATIAAASGNRMLVRIIADLRERTRLYGYERIPQRFEPGRHEHLGILGAMKARDQIQASMLMQQHLQNVSKGILASLVHP